MFGNNSPFIAVFIEKGNAFDLQVLRLQSSLFLAKSFWERCVLDRSGEVVFHFEEVTT